MRQINKQAAQTNANGCIHIDYSRGIGIQKDENGNVVRAYEGIDFVIIWVDGSDVSWQKEKASFSGEDKRPSKYRDWGLLRYWFRGVETFAPWVNRVHFVTCGHLPEWLNTEHPKLHVVKHADFIPGNIFPLSVHILLN